MSNNFAVVGLGSIAERHRQNIKALWPDSSIYAISSSGRAAKAPIANCDKFTANIADLPLNAMDMAIIASPAPFHVAHAMRFMRAGIPTLIEKPLCTNLEDASLLAQCAKDRNSRIAVGYCLRFLPTAGLMKQLIENRKVGQVLNVFIEVGQYLPHWRPSKHYKETVSANAALGGGALFELSHEFDYCQWIFGGLTLKHAYLRRSEQLQLNVEDIVDVAATLPNGALVNLHLDFLQQKAHRHCRVVGSEGTLNWDLIKNEVTFCNNDGCTTLYNEPQWDKNLMYTAMLEHFFGATTTLERSPICTLAEAVNTLSFINNIKHAARNAGGTESDDLE